MEFRIKEIEHRHIYDTIMNIFDGIRPTFSYSIENLKTFAVTAHPAFQIWLSACHFAGLGVQSNAIEELFGTKEFNEGNHAQLCRSYISQLGEFNLINFTRCSKSLQYVNSHISYDKIKILYSFLIVIELASFFIQDIDNVMRKQACVKDHTYSIVHLQVDNHDDGHGIAMLKQLEDEKNITVDEFNQGIQLFIILFGDIFKRLD